MSIARGDRAQRIAWLEGLAAAAKDAAKAEREVIEGEAKREHDGGCTPKWDVRDIGSIVSRVAHDRVHVSNPTALLDWTKQNHPEHLVEAIAPTFVQHIITNAVPDGAGGVTDDEGTTIPGVTFTPGGRFDGITFTVERTAKEVFALAAGMALEQAMRGPGSPFAAAYGEAAEAAALLAGETQGADETPAV